ncbi:MAG: nucleoside triphosphate pyrophosphohydrolase [Planctomycetia bacterium]|nr:nucleoside triphosphate pyrophosphohydrolase [Candidatus Brocadia sp.]QOJ06121.1 MAG: nucleoside triphosphate pyrophosphohydrolase [Planctomycetia bacterium]TVL96315.1 MAG: nucleoside triphosphate pyrophosphohydrolase [Candidatus Brocadia sp. BL1]HQU30494.1 nucleoside triphosphate pyrophosphohydrolase [Candidatus Brocadia sapporoensis]
MNTHENKSISSFQDLIELMRKLRSKDGCPWDKEQNHVSLKSHLIEETYEVIDAIDSGNPDKLKEELADLFFHIIFHCQIAREMGEFDIDSVMALCIDKMTRRHPHVFGDATATTPEEVIHQWEQIKKTEKGFEERKFIVDGLPRHLPALQKAQKLQKKVAKVGFDWTNIHDVIAKVDEELREVKEAIREKKPEHIEEEVGDLLFSIVNLARFLKLDTENVLHKTIYKFVDRFKKVETELTSMGKDIEKCTLEEMDAVWNKVKSNISK